MDNPINTLITQEDVENILNYFGGIGENNSKLHIKNLELYRVAFTNESYYQSLKKTISDPPEQLYIDYLPSESNERLEFLGDHVLKCIIGKYLYKRFWNEREGFLTTLKIKLENGKMLHKIGDIMGFKKFILLSLQVENQTILNTCIGRNTPSFYEDVFEAFIGAIFEDFGIDGYYYAEKFVVNVLENVVDFSELNSTNDNYKDSLQRYFQTLKLKPPTYIQIIKEKNTPVYRSTFTSIILITYQQFLLLEPVIQFKLKNYTENFLVYLNKINNNIDSEFKKMIVLKIKEQSYVLGIGSGKKIIDSCQKTAQQCLLNLNLDLTF